MPARRMLSVVVVVALVPAAGAAGHSLDADAQSGQAPTRESLAQVVKPPGAPGRTLGLSRVTIPPHTALAPHRHPGDQIAYIERGTLTYTVRTGVVRIFLTQSSCGTRPSGSSAPSAQGRQGACAWASGSLSARAMCTSAPTAGGARSSSCSRRCSPPGARRRSR